MSVVPAYWMFSPVSRTSSRVVADWTRNALRLLRYAPIFFRASIASGSMAGAAAATCAATETGINASSAIPMTTAP